jgi:hypothetical protein
MTHLEGPIVDAFYEIALHSWHNKLTPPLPCMSQPYQPPRDHAGNVRYLFQDHNPYFDDIEILKAARAARMLLRRQTAEVAEEEHRDRGAEKERFREVVWRTMHEQRNTLANWAPGEELEARAQNAMKEFRELREKWGLGSRAGSRRPSQTDVHMKIGGE